MVVKSDRVKQEFLKKLLIIKQQLIIMANNKVVTEVKVLSYAQRLSQSAQDKLTEEKEFQIQESKSIFEVAIAKTRMKLAEAKRALETARGADRLNPDELVRLRGVVIGYENGLAALEEEFGFSFPA